MTYPNIIKYIVASLFLIQGSLLPAQAQEPRNPFDFPILLSANFGELRSNHFHSGLDFKTQGVEGKPVHTVQEGYVSRISVSPWGYGNALYINHPDGTTTVYGHLKQFSKKIADYVKLKQYEQESFKVNLTLNPNEIPVKKDEVIALSGNTGSSGGPHLHFEIRDTESEEVLDPMDFYIDQIIDTRAPRIHAIMIVPQEGKGVVNGKGDKIILKPVIKNGKTTLEARLEAWGKIGLAIRCDDQMDKTTNIYGVKDILLTVDSQKVSHCHIDRFSFDDTRYINSLTDYAEWRNHNLFFVKSFIDPGNRLPFVEGNNRGVITIDEERKYRLTYRLTDAFGNSTVLTFHIQGKKQAIPKADLGDRSYFHWGSDNRFGAKGIRLYIPKGNLYDDLRFHYAVRRNTNALADLHILHDQPVPFHHKAQLSLFIRKDTLENKRQYGVVRFRGKRILWIGGVYRNGRVDADIQELGSYSVRTDTKAPTITPLNAANWLKRNRISLKLSDNLSGVESYRGEIDGKYALFEMNNRSVISYTLDRERLTKGAHVLRVTATDACGNESEYTYHFTW